MIGRHQQPVGPLFLQGRVQRSHDVPIDLLQGRDLGRGVPLVRRFVRRLNVDAHHIGRRNRLDRRAPFGRVIGIQVTGRSRHLNPLPAD